MDLVQAILGFLHLLATVIWIGGMAFNIFVLRPFLGMVDSPQRLRLVRSILQRFIYAAWLCIATLFLTGVFIANPSNQLYRPVLIAKHWVVIAMVAIVAIITFILFPRFKAYITEKSRSEEVAKALGSIVLLVKMNLILGFAVLFITAILEEI